MAQDRLQAWLRRHAQNEALLGAAFAAGSAGLGLAVLGLTFSLNNINPRRGDLCD
jgi:hypothetical protein